MASLQKKVELNYRRGGTAHNCSDCNYFKAANGISMSPGGKPAPSKPRCKIMGLKPGRLYDINPNNICDAYDNSFMLKRLRGEKTWQKDR